MPLSNFSTEDIESFFHKGPYYVPDYQRDYAWTDKEEVKDFFEDLMTVIKAEFGEYFIGQIVVHNSIEDGKKYLIDGQQRSVTTSIFFKVLQGMFEEINTSEFCEPSVKKKADMLRMKATFVLSCVDKEEGKDALWLGEEDREFFRNTVIYGPAKELMKMDVKAEKLLSLKNMIKAYQFLYNSINDLLEDVSFEVRLEKLASIYDALSNTFKVLYVETTNEEEAFVIFETLNGRGRDLATSDLLKNYLFRRAGDKKRPEIKANWIAMTSNLPDSSITNYLRYLWNAYHPFCREKMLYRAITDKEKGVATPAACIDFSAMLRDYSSLYRALVHPGDYSAFKDKAITEQLTDLSGLKTSTFYPVVFALKGRKYSEQDILRALKAIESLVVRDLVIAERSPSSYEVSFAAIARGITALEIDGIDEVIAAIKDASDFPDDAAFIENFARYKAADTPRGKDKVRFLLRRIENSKRSETGVLLDNKQVHIEHIMPVTKGDWDVPDDLHAEYLWRLGNLTLLGSEYNIPISNSLFDNKKERYEQSDLNITKEITKYKKWRPRYTEDGAEQPGEIELRQAELAQEAAKIWAFV